MKAYEGIFIIKPDLNEEGEKNILGLIEGEIKKDGSVDNIQGWGRKKLAYLIKKFEEGVYYKIDFTMNPAALKDMDRKFRLTEDIVRFLIIKKEK